MNKVILLTMVLTFTACATKSDLRKTEDSFNSTLDEKVNTMKEDLKNQMKKEILSDAKSELIKELKEEVYVEINKSLEKDRKEVEEVMTLMAKEFESYKDVLRKAIAEELVSLRNKIGEEVEVALIEGPFVKNLESKITDSLSNIAQEKVEESKDEMIKSCVEEALDELVVKQIGVKSSELN